MDNTGILHTTNYIYFQLVSPDGNILHTFTGASHAIPCLPGDTCTWDDDHCVLVKRKTHPPLTGILHLQSKYRYGMTSRGSPLYLFTPLNAGYPPMIAGCSYKNNEKNMLATVDFENWVYRSSSSSTDKASTMLNTHARCNLRTMIGPCGDRTAEEKAILETYTPYKIPVSWTYHVFEEMFDELSHDRVSVPPYTFHIDPSGCKDIDDVISIEYRDDGNTYIWITISDVAAIVEVGSREDLYAATLCQTTYSLDGTVLKPMLPAYYSENVCSLLPGKSRLGMSLVCRVDENGGLIPEKLCKTRVLVEKSYTYESVLADLEFPKDLLCKITQGILGKGNSCEDPHKWIEALMIYYNNYIARLLCTIGRGVLRAHDGLNPEAYELLRGLGDDSLYAYANYAATYVDVQQSYDAEKYAHKALGLDYYCHATSPIRRYADLINQRIVKAYLENKMDGNIPDYSVHQLQLREKDNKRYARDSQLLACLYDAPDKIIRASILRIEGCGEENSNQIKITAWVHDWKKRISWEAHGSLAETTVHITDITTNTTIPIKMYETINLTYKTQPNQIRWKDRILFKPVIME
jgi:hypothetical protein